MRTALVVAVLVVAAALLAVVVVLGRPRAARFGRSGLGRRAHKIPRIIHQTVRSRDAISDRLRTHIEAIKRQNPGWEHRLYDNADVERIIRRRMPQVYAAFKRLNPEYGPAVADVARYVVVFLDGGVYLDSKSGVSRPLDEIIEPADTFLCQSGERYDWGQYHDIPHNNGYEIMQWFIVATARNPLLRAVLEAVVRNIEDPANRDQRGKIGVLRVTGPIAYSKAVYPLLASHEHRMLPNDDASFVYQALGNRDYWWRDYDTSRRPYYEFRRDRVLLPRKTTRPGGPAQAFRIQVDGEPTPTHDPDSYDLN